MYIFFFLFLVARLLALSQRLSTSFSIGTQFFRFRFPQDGGHGGPHSRLSSLSFPSPAPSFSSVHQSTNIKHTIDALPTAASAACRSAALGRTRPNSPKQRRQDPTTPPPPPPCSLCRCRHQPSSSSFSPRQLNSPPASSSNNRRPKASSSPSTSSLRRSTRASASACRSLRGFSCRSPFWLFGVLGVGGLSWIGSVDQRQGEWDNEARAEDRRAVGSQSIE
jgi:hypothetical protein